MKVTRYSVFTLFLSVILTYPTADAQPIFEAADYCDIAYDRLSGEDLYSLWVPRKTQHSDGSYSEFASIRTSEEKMLVPIAHREHGRACLELKETDGLIRIRFRAPDFGELFVKFGSTLFHEASKNSHSHPVESIFHISRLNAEGKRWSQESRELFIHGEFANGRYLLDGQMVYHGDNRSYGQERIKSAALARSEFMKLPEYGADIKKKILEDLNISGFEQQQSRTSEIFDSSPGNCEQLALIPGSLRFDGRYQTQSAGVACAIACGSAIGCVAAATGATAATGGIGVGAYATCTGAAGGCGYCIGKGIDKVMDE